VASPKQANPKQIFELSNLPTHGALRQVQLRGRTRNAAVPPHALEGEQRRNRWQRLSVHVFPDSSNRDALI